MTHPLYSVYTFLYIFFFRVPFLLCEHTYKKFSFSLLLSWNLLFNRSTKCWFCVTLRLNCQIQNCVPITDTMCHIQTRAQLIQKKGYYVSWIYKFFVYARKDGVSNDKEMNNGPSLGKDLPLLMKPHARPKLLVLPWHTKFCGPEKGQLSCFQVEQVPLPLPLSFRPARSSCAICLIPKSCKHTPRLSSMSQRTGKPCNRSACLLSPSPDNICAPSWWQ